MAVGRMSGLAVAATLIAVLAGGVVRAENEILSAGIDAGQLVVVKGEHIRLDWEDLHISPEAIVVSHQFTNTSAKEIVSTVAFPLAPIDLEKNLSFTVEARNTGDIVGFKVTVDGIAVTPNVEIRAQRGGRDITDLLVRHGVPLIPFAADPERGMDAYFEKVGSLSDAAREELETVDALSFDDPLWTVQVVYHWAVRFRPNQPVEISHNYTPVPATALLSRNGLAKGPWSKRYCMDNAVKAAIRARLAPPGGDGPENVAAQVVRYVLAGADRKPAPIGRFYLTIDNGEVDALVAMCGNGIRKSGDTTYRMERFDYVPKGDLRILFIRDLDMQ